MQDDPRQRDAGSRPDGSARPPEDAGRRETPFARLPEDARPQEARIARPPEEARQREARSAPPPEDARQREAREALDRVARDSEIMGSSAIPRAGRRMGDHFAGRDAIGEAEGGGTDPVELWGRRIGRALSVVGFIALALWLAHQLGMV